LNIEKTGAIKPHELRSMLSFWGMEVSDEQFKEFFNRIDADGDG
jgi:Ca2+-binding EF-hand superfamily protein